ncbi:MAG: proton-conducting transporter transmembrane domain-containing protein, partial [Nocardioides sp.]
MSNVLPFVIALPLLGAAVLLIGGRRTDSWGPYLATPLPIASFVCALVLFVHNLGQPDDARSQSVHLWTWFEAGKLNVGADLLYDQLSSLFLLLITGVGSLIHVYSLGYMAHDERKRRFFGYLNLFVAAMLTLVLAANYLVLFLGWEGVGLASYLLIGFWQHKPSAAAAAKKAFVMNRVGDMGLSLAIALCFTTFGSTSFSVVNAGVPHASETTMTWLGLLLLLG